MAEHMTEIEIGIEGPTRDGYRAFVKQGSRTVISSDWFPERRQALMFSRQWVSYAQAKRDHFLRLH